MLFPSRDSFYENRYLLQVVICFREFFFLSFFAGSKEFQAGEDGIQVFSYKDLL